MSRGTRAAATLSNHILFVAAALLFFVAALELRIKAADQPSSTLLAFALPIAGALLLAIGGFFGAELVYTHGVGLRRSNAAGDDVASSRAITSHRV